MRFEAKKTEQREQNMTSLYNLLAPRTSLDATTLLNAPVILFDIPSKILERFSIRFRRIQNISSPVFWFLGGMNDPEHLDETVLYQVNDSSFRRDINSKTERLNVLSGSTNMLDLNRVHQCHFSERINFRLSILEYHESKMTQPGLNFRSSAARSISRK